MARREELPARQRDLFRALCRHADAHNRLPTNAELARDINAASPGQVATLLTQLEERGLLQRETSGKTRKITLVGEATLQRTYLSPIRPAGQRTSPEFEANLEAVWHLLLAWPEHLPAPTDRQIAGRLGLEYTTLATGLISKLVQLGRVSRGEPKGRNPGKLRRVLILHPENQPPRALYSRLAPGRPRGGARGEAPSYQKTLSPGELP